MSDWLILLACLFVPVFLGGWYYHYQITSADRKQADDLRNWLRKNSQKKPPL